MKTHFAIFATALLSSSALAQGTVFSGRVRTYGDVEAANVAPGIFRIVAESPEKAGLWQAKWLFDLTNTVGSVERLHVRGIGDAWHTLPMANARGGGEVFLAGVRDGRVFMIVTAPTLDGLAGRAKAAGVKGVLFAKGETDCTTRLPMWVVGMEQWPFRFYYRPSPEPSGDMAAAKKDGREPYDPTWEFDYAKANGHLGFVFWMQPAWSDWAWGMRGDGDWGWAHALAKARGVPSVMNTMIDEKAQLLYPRQWMQRAPTALAGRVRQLNPIQFGQQMAWSSVDWRISAHRETQDRILAHNGEDILDILEPDGELAHGTANEMLEYGPLADASFRDYLREAYGSLAAVSKRFTGRPDGYSSWDDVHLPEIAEFAGFDPSGGRSVNLSGTWRRILRKPVARDDIGGCQGEGVEDFLRGLDFNDAGSMAAFFEPYPDGWEKPEFDEDAAGAETIQDMPGTQEILFLKKRPAALRLHFNLDRVPEGRVWLQVWDENAVWHYNYRAFINGEQCIESRGRHAWLHRMTGEVTGMLREGGNVLALDLPLGFLGYRCYLTSEPPRAYPSDDECFNARWYDFCKWQGWARARAVEIGMGAIREVEPDKDIIQMAPDRYLSPVKEVARKYGARFHNTGSMAAYYCDYLVGHMRSLGRPFSLEPGGPAKTLPDFRRDISIWLAEDVNMIHYFIHVGDILNNPEIKAEFERVMPMLGLAGQRRQLRASVAFLEDSDVAMLDTFPCEPVARPTGYSPGWNPLQFNFPTVETDNIAPGDFPAGVAERYPVILDLNTSVIDGKLAAGIEGYVRNGGTFIAQWRTGENSPTRPDAWVLSDVSGCRSERWSAYDPVTGEPAAGDAGRGAAESRDWIVFDDSVTNVFTGNIRGDGNRLVLTVPEGDPSVRVIARWRKDGSPAVVERRVGEGRFITLGFRVPIYNAHIVEPFLRYAGARQRLLTASRPADWKGGYPVMPRAWVSGNGLYDIFFIGTPNGGGARDVPYKLGFADGRDRELADVLTGGPLPKEGVIDGLMFAAGIAPRFGAADDAGALWFEKEAGRWTGAEKPAVKASEAPLEYDRYVLPLDDGWEIAPLLPAKSADEARDFEAAEAFYRSVTNSAFLADVPESAWRESGLTSLAVGANIAAEDGLVFAARRKITVPSDWNDGGDIGLWATAMYPGDISFCGSVKYFLDRELIQDNADRGITGRPVTAKPGETFELVMVMLNRHVVIRGIRGNVFLTHFPKACREIDLSGEWMARAKYVTDEPVAVAVPMDGARRSIRLLARDVTLAEWDLPRDGEEAFIDIDGADGYLDGVFVNGTYVHRHHHRHGSRMLFNIGPYIHEGANRITIVTCGWDNVSRGVTSARLKFVARPEHHLRERAIVSRAGQ